MRLPQNNRSRRVCVGAAIAILSLGGAGESSAQMVNTKPPEPAKKIEGMASWYAVPRHSRTKQRAGKDELTGATNRFPLGTRLRVTQLSNKKSVMVRIIDSGVYRHGVVIDLCKEAAEQLDMLREGSTRVQLEVVPEDKGAAPKTKTPPW